MQNQANAGGNDEAHKLGMFLRGNPPTFRGKYDPDGVQALHRETERIFRVLDCSETHKVRFGTHMLADKADDLWLSTRQRF